jgi:hypothetical protein
MALGFCADSLSEMSLGKRDARPRFQIALEGNRASLVGELDNKVNGPRSVLGRMDTAAGIVLRAARRNV